MFSRQQVKKSFRTFHDLSDDLKIARFQNWEESLRHLIEHCQTDPVMKVVTEPLLTHPNVNLANWHRDFSSSGRGMIGTSRYSIPTNEEEQTALLYQFLVAIVNGTYSALDFSLHAYGEKTGQGCVNSFNSQIVQKFVRAVTYRIDGLDVELGDKQQVDSSALNIFYLGTVQNFHGAVQSIQGGVYGGIVATESTVTDNTITYNDKSAFLAAVRLLNDSLGNVLQGHHNAVSDAFEVLIRAIETNTAPKTSQLASAVETIGEGSPTKLKSLKTIVEGAVGNLVAEVLKPLLISVMNQLGLT